MSLCVQVGVCNVMINGKELSELVTQDSVYVCVPLRDIKLKEAIISNYGLRNL